MNAVSKVEDLTSTNRAARGRELNREEAMENSEFVRRALGSLRSAPRLGPTFKLDAMRIERDGAALLGRERSKRWRRNGLR